MITKGNVEIGLKTSAGPDCPSIRCGARTRRGTPCQKPPLKGKNRCRLHGGLSSGPKTAEGRAMIAAANTKHGRYKNWREKQAKERYYQGEIKRVMYVAREAGLLKY